MRLNKNMRNIILISLMDVIRIKYQLVYWDLNLATTFAGLCMRIYFNKELVNVIKTVYIGMIIHFVKTIATELIWRRWNSNLKALFRGFILLEYT